MHVIIFAYTSGQPLSPSALSLAPPSLAPFPARSRWSVPAWNNSWLVVGEGAASSVRGERKVGEGLLLRRTLEKGSERACVPPLQQRTERPAFRERGPAGCSHRSRTPSSPSTLLPSLVAAAGATSRDSISQRALLLSPGLQAARPDGSCSPSLLGGLGLDRRETREG